MRLTKIEFKAMNNPIRRFIQKNIEFNIFKKFLDKHRIDLRNKVILDAGCGSGYSSQLILNEFSPSKLLAFDFMPEQIELAKMRKLDVDFFVGDVTNIELPSNSVDTVFIFGILYHVPKWQVALKEINRVLKNDGILLVEEIDGKLGTFFNDYLGFDHPKEARFSWEQFTKGLTEAGFIIIDSKTVIKGTKSYLCKKEIQ